MKISSVSKRIFGLFVGLSLFATLGFSGSLSHRSQWIVISRTLILAYDLYFPFKLFHQSAEKIIIIKKKKQFFMFNILFFQGGTVATSCSVDLVLVLDSSGSLGETGWRLVKEFASAIVEQLPIGSKPHETRYSILFFSVCLYINNYPLRFV